MRHIAESAIGPVRSWPGTDFMRRSYELNGEPLRLLQEGLQWFSAILSHEYHPEVGHSALVLGATPWLSDLVRRRVDETTVADTSSGMLAFCANSIRRVPGDESRRCVRFLRSNWLALPPTVRNLHIVAGDNALSFLCYPAEWDEMLAILSDRMATGSVILMRVLSIPGTYRRLCPAEIVESALRSRRPVNLTAVRVALLFAHWNPANYVIRPEEALATFVQHRQEFDCLLDERDGVDNDLVSIDKYRHTGARYFAPPLADAVARFERHFHVRAVYFGQYDMSQYFPLIVASKRGE